MDKQRVQNWLEKRKKRRKDRSVAALFTELTAGNRETLSMCITLVESTLLEDKKMANELIQRCLAFSGNSSIKAKPIFLRIALVFAKAFLG